MKIGKLIIQNYSSIPGIANMSATNVQARMLQSNESLRGMLYEGLRRFLLKQNQKEKQNGCTEKSPIDRTFEKYD